MADAVEYDHVQRTDALDVLGARLIGMRVEARRDQRHDVGLVADDIAHVAVVRVQGNADAQAFGRFGGEAGRRQQGDHQPRQQDAQQGTAFE